MVHLHEFTIKRFMRLRNVSDERIVVVFASPSEILSPCNVVCLLTLVGGVKKKGMQLKGGAEDLENLSSFAERTGFT